MLLISERISQDANLIQHKVSGITILWRPDVQSVTLTPLLCTALRTTSPPFNDASFRKYVHQYHVA